MPGDGKFTAVFDCDIRMFPTNPCKAKTPFGYAIRCGIGDAFNDIDKAEDEITQLRTLLDDAERALHWYREQTRLCRLIHSEGDAGRHALSEDGGNRASKTLSAIKQYKEEKEK